MDKNARIPYIGSGIGYRKEIMKEIGENINSIQCIEIITENYIRKPKALTELKKNTEGIVVIPHGVSLSIASPYLNDDFLCELKIICDYLDAPYYSEHLCLTRSPGIDLGHLTPIPYTEKMLNLVVNNIHTVQNYLEIPIILENITYPFDFSNNTFTQSQFFSEVISQTKCGILLDIENLYINSNNHHFDPIEFLVNLPLDSIIQLHLAGGVYTDNYLFDTHSELIKEPIWELLEVVLSKCINVKSIIIEHDSNFPDNFELLLAQVKKAQKIMAAIYANFGH